MANKSLLAFLTLWALECALLWSLGLDVLVSLVPDDSFFYLVIARQFFESWEFSFDGVAQTYGFQPLWQLLLLPLGLLGWAPEQLFGVTLALCAGLHVGSVFLLWRLLDRLLIPDARRLARVAVFVFWGLNPGVMRWFWGAKENGVYFLLLVALALVVLRALRSEGARRDVVWVGALAGACCLARVTFVPLAAALVAWVVVVALVRGSRATLRALPLVVGAAALVAGPWFVFAWLHFGTAMPISGLVKFEQAATFAAERGMEWGGLEYVGFALARLPGYADQTLKLCFAAYGPVVLACFVGAALLSVKGERALPAAKRAGWRHGAGASGLAPRLILALGIADAAGLWLLVGASGIAVLNAGMTVYALPSFLAYGQWYTVPEYFALIVLAAAAASSALRANSLVRNATLVLAVALLAAWHGVRERGLQLRFDPYATDLAVHPNLVLKRAGEVVADAVGQADLDPRAPTRIAAWDPGILAFFADHPITSLDPLMNSLEFNAKHKHDLVGFIRDRDIAYVWGPATVREGQLLLERVPAHTYSVVPDALGPPFDDIPLDWNPAAEERYVLTRWPVRTPTAVELP